MKLVPGVIDNSSGQHQRRQPRCHLAQRHPRDHDQRQHFGAELHGRRHHGMDTGSNSTLHYEPNMDADSGTEDPDLELPGGIRTQLGRHHHLVTKSGTQEFHGIGGLEPPQRGVQRQSWVERPQRQKGGRHAGIADLALPFQRRNLHHRRSRLYPAPVQYREEQAVLLLVAGVYRPVRQRRRTEQVHAHRARAPGRFFPELAEQRLVDRRSRIPPRARRSPATRSRPTGSRRWARRC